MSQYDLMYKEMVEEILADGIWDKDQKVRTVWADGTPAYTKGIIGKQFRFGSEVPILTTKRVAWKSAIHELLWFYVKRTSDATYLKENNVKIWDEWIRTDGTIGKAYGYQAGKPIIVGHTDRDEVGGWLSTKPIAIFSNQVHKMINEINNIPASRRHIISFWNIDDLWDMALAPCVWNFQVMIKQGKLYILPQCRSNDVGLGQPFNIFQYHVLGRMIAQVTGYEFGGMIFTINDCHIYERHIDGLIEQISREPYPAPKLWINQDVKNIDNFTIDDFLLVNPELTDFQVQDMNREEALQYVYYQHHDTIPFEVAI